MKPHFLASETYKRGFVLQNRTEKRQRTTEDEKKETFDKIITVSSYDLYARGLTDREENKNLAEKKVGEIGFTEDFFSIHILRKALVRAENGFFRFENLREHITDLASIDDFISRELRRYTIEYFFDAEKEIFRLSPHEKLQLLIGAILPEVRKHIDMTLPKIVGSPLFRPVSIEYTFSRQKDLFFASFPVINPDTGKLEFARHDERMKPQTNNPNRELELDISTQDWYAYSENYGTSEEKKFIRFMETKMDSLRKQYSGCEIFLVRNELEYWMFGLSNGKRFSPDYLMFIHDTGTRKLYYQCVFEVK
jgi:type III restriction enzyme